MEPSDYRSLPTELVPIGSREGFRALMSVAGHYFPDDTYGTGPRSIVDVHDTYHLTHENVVLTCYFNMRRDPQRNMRQKSDNFEYIRPWYDSMKRLGLHGIIFYDRLSEGFVKRYQTDRIIFKRCVYGGYSLNDERFFMYYLYLSANPYRRVFMTDVSDIVIKKDPFVLVTDPERLCVGDEAGMLVDNSWCQRQSTLLFNSLAKRYRTDFSTHFMQMPCYNAGVIGGEYKMVMFLLANMISIFNQVDNNLNNDMMVLHLVIFLTMFYDYTGRGGDRVTTHIMAGYPLTSGFKKYEVDADVYFVHK